MIKPNTRILTGLCLLLLAIPGFTQPFAGKIAKRYEVSVESWPTQQKAPDNAPNILIVLLDDTGFAQFGSFGGLIETPNIDALAESGLRYNNFHTTALCSPSRASLLTGRNHHSVGLGSHSITAMGFPGYNAQIPPTAKSIATILQMNGYTTFAVGKWDHTPLREVSVAGPFDRWPSGEGFDHFYGFMAADTDQFAPALYTGHQPIEPWRGREDYHLTTDMADRAIEYITAHKSVAPNKPFLMYWAPGATHAPLQAPAEFIEKYRGRFDQGWDWLRSQILERQLATGIIPRGTGLSERIGQIPAWDNLPEQERILYRRQMEAFAGMLDHTDQQIGRIIDTLKRIGELDNTLVIVTSDNGASGDGGLTGTYNEQTLFNVPGQKIPLDVNMQFYDDWGGPTTAPHYHAGWAMAGNTPFRYFKQSSHRGGIQDPLVISWPAGIKSTGQIRNQYHHIIDLMPTLLEITGIELPQQIDGVEQLPVDGVSMAYSFDQPDAPTSKQIQYYELYGNRAIWQDGWKAVTLHGQRMPWDLNSRYPFEDDEWELYHVAEDFAEARNLAGEFPDKLAQLQAAWDRQAWKYNVYPLYDDMIQRARRRAMHEFATSAAAQNSRTGRTSAGHTSAGRSRFTYYAPGAYRISETIAPPMKNLGHSISTTIDYTGGEEGVIAAAGGLLGGFSLYIDNNRLHFEYIGVNNRIMHIESPSLKRGQQTVAFQFQPTGFGQGTGLLLIDGVIAASKPLTDMYFASFSLSETFDIGRDTGTPASRRYSGEFPYNGVLDRVHVDIQLPTGNSMP